MKVRLPLFEKTTFIFSNQSFKGDWLHGGKTGVGKFFYPDGSLRYFGNISDGLAHGHGSHFYQNGNILFAGEWKHGEFSQGKLLSQGKYFKLT